MEQFNLKLLFWETTQKCNLACSHCRMDIEKSFKEIDTNQAKQLIDSIVEFSSPIFIFSGGEPLLRKDIFELFRYSVNKGLRIALATNGTLITKDVAKDIISSGVKRVSVSLDGSDSLTHDSFRNSEGSFNLAITGINNLVSKSISTQINATITRHNLNQIEDLIKIALENKCDAIHFFVVVPVGCGKQLDKSGLLTVEEYEKTLQIIFNLSNKYENDIFIKLTCAPQYYRILKQNKPEVFQEQNHSLHRISKGCLAGTNVCFVSSTGDVYPCGYLPQKAGNILHTPLEHIWEESDLFKTLRNNQNLKENCCSCVYLNVCGGCRARAYFSGGDIMGADPECILNSPIKNLNK